MTVRKTPNGRWRADLKVAGSRLSKTFTLKRDAQAWVHEQQVEAERGSWHDPRRAGVPLREVHERWAAARSVSASTLATDRAIWRAYVAPRFGDMRLDRITRTDIRAWLAAMTRKDGQPAAARTRKHALRVLRAVLAWAVEEGRIRENPAATIPVKGATRSGGAALDADQLDRFIAALNPPARPIARVLAYTGLRVSELAALNVGDVIERDGALVLLVRSRWVMDGRGKRVRLAGTKAGADVTRTVPVLDVIRPDVEAALARARGQGRGASAAASSRPLFPASRGGARLDARNWRRDAGWKAAVESIGVPNFRTHDLRHTAATLWLGTTGSVKATQAILGHSSASVTLDIYGHVLDSERARAVAVMNDAVGASAAREAHENGAHPVG